MMFMRSLRAYTKWLTPGIGVKRWLILELVGLVLIASAITVGWLRIAAATAPPKVLIREWWEIGAAVLVGLALTVLGLLRLSNNLLAPYRVNQRAAVVDVVYAHSKRNRGQKIVVIGGGTGLPSVLRGLKPFTGNLTAVVTVADDGGSSGRLRREMGVLPPGDLRNNIAALADDENLMTQLFQYRFSTGDLGGHAFGNLFITALAGVTGSLETALVEVERVLNIQGRVLPATLDDVTLGAEVLLPGTGRGVHVRGESMITESGGKVERVDIEPPDAAAYSESVQAILDAEIVVIGPGSLYTSILPNLLVKGIAEALRATSAYKVYICNVATQPGETEGYSVAEHVLALEKHIGRGMFQGVLANNGYPELDAVSINTRFVQPAPAHHDILQRYDVRYTDLVDERRPWRHDPVKLANAILSSGDGERSATLASGATLVHE